MSQRRLFYVAVSACHIAVKIARIILKNHSECCPTLLQAGLKRHVAGSVPDPD
jgi:hypothetical protein